MGRLNEQGLQRLVGNIKEDINNRIDEINTEVENTKNELKKTENTKYTTSNGVKTFECAVDGYIDNISMEGETLVNLWGIDSSKFDLNQSNTFKDGVLTLNGASAFSRGYCTDFSRLKPSTTYALGSVE